MLLRYRSFRSVSWEIKKRRGRGEAYGGGDEGMSSIFGFPVLVFAFSMIPHTCLDTPSFEIFANSAAKVPLRHRWDCVLNRGKCRRQCYCAIAQACLVGALCELFRFSLSRIYNVVCLIQLIHGQTMVRENPYVWSLLFLVLSCLARHGACSAEEKHVLIHSSSPVVIDVGRTETPRGSHAPRPEEEM